MRLYACPACGARLYFRNSACGACGVRVVYSDARDAFVANADSCSNREDIGCNWADEDVVEHLCRSCQMTDVIPDLSVEPNAALWAEGETAKRWVLATLSRWGWFGAEDPGPLPVFHFKSERTHAGPERVMMGHAAGVITLNVAEADDAIRVRNREMLDEEYRTMLGHLRHELAHFIFDRLAAEPGFSEAFRALFGDERTDYGEALRRHYSEGPRAEWSGRFITPYASAHPHEDWAETVAHLMHLTDIVDAATAVELAWPTTDGVPADAYETTDSDALIHAAVDLGLALNQVNRAMGLADLYPFVLTEAVRDKLAFSHFWLNRRARLQS
nr:putative zinc-binding metallopeptidase [Tropicimonas marinistellae]